MTDPNTTGIARAVIKAGSVAALAREVGVARQVADRWVKRGHVPPARAFQMERLYGVAARTLIKPSLLRLAARLAE